MALDPRFVTGFSLEEYFVDKISGLPLADGTIEFYKDSARTTPKAVYELTGSPPNYTYTALSNPVELSGVGTIDDGLGNNVALYAFPYTSLADDAELELYYVVVKDSSGLTQFTREAWPNLTAQTDPLENSNNAIINQLSNPQFAEVLFDTSSPLVISFTGSATDTYDIAPDWKLAVEHSGSGNVTVARNAVAGSSQYPTNPPYTMSFTPGSNIVTLKLIQRLPNNPNIWAPKTGAENGWIGANITLADMSSATIYYLPNGLAAQTILSETNLSGVYQEFTNSVQLSAASNPSNGDAGYVDIVILLSNTIVTTLTSVQIVGLQSEDQNIQFNQAPINRQKDQLFHYYEDALKYKPVDSYLVGWDFPTNPAQRLGSTIAAFATGNNTSNYTWDRTIAFQSVNSGLTFSRATSGSFKVTAAATGQFALVQYLEVPIATQALEGPLSINVSALTSVVSGVVGTVALYYTSDPSVPDMTANTSLIATLNANGGIATDNGGWTAVPRPNKLDAIFKVRTSATTDYNDYGFTGWDMAGIAAVNTTTYIAVVIGFASMTTADYIEFNSISLVPGDVATRPAPKTPGQVLFECQRYYETSYLSNVVPGTASSVNAIAVPQLASCQDANGYVNFVQTAFTVQYKNEKQSSSVDFYIYSSNTGTVDTVYGTIVYPIHTTDGSSALTFSSLWSVLNSDTKCTSYRPTTTASSFRIKPDNTFNYTPGSAYITFHYVADSEIGIV